jgi:tripartite-type tricarboxylate transporter receptor subunit TctC
LAGQVQIMLNSMPTMLPHVKSGKLRALAVGSARRAKAVPDMVTIAEAGVPGFAAVAWAGLAAPANTPAGIIGKLNQEVARVLGDADIVQRLATQGAEAQSSTPEGFAQFMREESVRARKVIASAGIKSE